MHYEALLDSNPSAALAITHAKYYRFNDRAKLLQKSMTKRDIVVRINEETGILQQDVLKVVQRTLDLISEAVAAGTTVELPNFGVFEVRVRKSRIGRNPNRPEIDVAIPRCAARGAVKWPRSERFCRAFCPVCSCIGLLRLR
jgi:nucleoid DNA-binding protein